MQLIFRGSILEAPVDVIVNPANSFLRHGGGLARVIDEAASNRGFNAYVEADWKDLKLHTIEYTNFHKLIEEYRQYRPGLVPTGGAVLGPAGALSRRFKGIIHAVGPIWGGGEYLERALLYRAYFNAIEIAEDAGFESIAFPAISAGVFGVPINVVAAMAVSATHASKLDVTFALMEESHVEAFSRALNLPVGQEA